MLFRFETENLSNIFFNARIPRDNPDLPGPVFKRGCRTNGVCHTTGHLKNPGLKFSEASDKATDDDKKGSASSVVSRKQTYFF